MEKKLILLMLPFTVLLYSMEQKKSGPLVQLITLHNGSQLPAPDAWVIYKHCKQLFEKNHFAFYELLEKCHNPNHTPCHFTEILHKYYFLDDANNVRENVKNVVLSSIKKNNEEIKLRSPFKRQA